MDNRFGRFRAKREKRQHKPYSFGLTEQDGATALTATCRIAFSSPMPAVNLRQMLVESLVEIQTQIETNGGIVGHIKCFADTDGSFLQISCTGFEPQYTMSAGWDSVNMTRAEVRVAVIAFAYDADAVRSNIKALFERLVDGSCN